VGAGGVEARAGALGVLQFVGVQQQGRQKGPLAADKGLHRVDPAEVALQQKDAVAIVGHGEAGAGDGGLHVSPVEVFQGHIEEGGHGLGFLGAEVDAAAAGAAVAAEAAVEDR